MLDIALVDKIDTCLAKISEKLPGYQYRPSQYKMIMAVAETFSRSPVRNEEDGVVREEAESLREGESILVVEGPTGIGKSVGYLLPAIIMAQAMNKRCVVSSATVALQEQLANKDLPFLARYAGLSISYVVAKGRGRYLCPYRLKQQVSTFQQAALPLETMGAAPLKSAGETKDLSSNVEIIPSKETSSNEETLTQWLQWFEEGRWSGDRDLLPAPVEDALWIPHTNDRHGCLQKECPEYAQCPFFLARAHLNKADVIIANHDLLLADIHLGGGVILPAPSQTFYCIDEAHHLAEKAVQQFSGSHTLQSTFEWLVKIAGKANEACQCLKDAHSFPRISELSDTFSSYLHDFESALENFPELALTAGSLDSQKIFRFPSGILDPPWMILCENLKKSSQSLLSCLYALQNKLKEARANADEKVEQKTVLDKILRDMGFYIGRMAHVASVWRLFSEVTPPHTPPIAKWITVEVRDLQGKGHPVIRVSASPVRVGDRLAHQLWSRAAGCVLTSATLQSLGHFEHFLSNVGLEVYPQVTCMVLASPFNFQAQGRLVIPPMRSTPKEAATHTEEIIRLLPTLLPLSGGNGALVLFSSRKQMQAVAQGLPPAFQHQLLIQGTASKEMLLKKHFSRITNNEPSILFGLASFAEGLDLPGNACKHVVIAKLPFEVPDDPVSQTLAEWMKGQGRNPFLEMTLPAASIKLVQAVGRLIRTEEDTGVVSILDKRLLTQRYGRQLLNSLPPFKREF